MRGTPGVNEKNWKLFRSTSLLGAAALVGYGSLTLSGLAGKNTVFEHLSMYFRTLVFVTVLLMPFYTTGILGKIRRRNKAANLSKPVQLVLAGVAAFALAFVLKLLLTAAGL